METKLGIKDEISCERLNYRIDNLLYSQSMLTTFKKSKGEFIDKYIRNIFWSDDTAKDRQYQENMSYGRDFHRMCQRVFLGIDESMNISSASQEEKRRIYSIKEQYINLYGEENIVFCPECKIEYLPLRLEVQLDLLVKVYENSNLSQLFIWDWKVEDSNITLENALSRMQTATYMYVCKETLGKELDFDKLVMYYYQPKKNKNTKIIYSQKEHLKFEKHIRETIKEIQSLKV